MVVLKYSDQNNYIIPKVFCNWNASCFSFLLKVGKVLVKYINPENHNSRQI
jgi:hypothetical protein